MLQKTTLLICLKLIVHNKDTFSKLHINFLRDWMSFNIDRNIKTLAK